MKLNRLTMNYHHQVHTITSNVVLNDALVSVEYCHIYWLGYLRQRFCWCIKTLKCWPDIFLNRFTKKCIVFFTFLTLFCTILDGFWYWSFIVDEWQCVEICIRFAPFKIYSHLILNGVNLCVKIEWWVSPVENNWRTT